MEDVAETLSIMEKEFLPSFFDSMVPLTIHLVEELFICGPVYNRWMYLYKRYFEGLKQFVCNLAKPKGSIVLRIPSGRGTWLCHKIHVVIQPDIYTSVG